MGMIEIKQYWIEDTPKIEDVEMAFRIVKEQNVVVQLKWYVEYSGSYRVFIHPDDIEIGVKKFFEHKIPHIYGV